MFSRYSEPVFRNRTGQKQASRQGLGAIGRILVRVASAADPPETIQRWLRRPHKLHF
jgi:hypothetical protein